MSVCKDYTAEQERVELLELARRACAMFGCDDSPENLEWVLEGWHLFASCHDVSVLEAGKKALTEFEIADKINAEATTCRERRKMLAARMNLSLEEYEEDFEAWGFHEDEVFWLQERTGEENAVLNSKLRQQRDVGEELLVAIEELKAMNNPTSEMVERVAVLQERYDALVDKNHKAIARERRRLERKLLVMTLKARRPAAFRLKVYMPSFRRAHTRAPRSARRASFSVAASSPGGGESSGESDQGDPPGPHPFRTFVTPPSNLNHNQRPLRPWLGLGCCRMERGRSAW